MAVFIKTTNSGHSLPSDYQEVEYLQVSNYGYVDTGIYVTSNLSFYIKFKRPGVNIQSIPFGIYDGTRPVYLLSFYSQYHTTTQFGGSNGGAATTLSIVDTTHAHSLYGNLSTGQIIYDDVDNTFSNMIYTGSQSTVTVGLFSRHELTSFWYGTGLIMYECKMWESDVLMKHYIPCYRVSDNVPGVYDLVNSEFITISGSNPTIVVGQDIPSETLKQVGYTVKLPEPNNLKDIWEGTTTEFVDNSTTTITSGANTIPSPNQLTSIRFKKLLTNNSRSYFLSGAYNVEKILFDKLTSINSYHLYNCSPIRLYLPKLTTMGTASIGSTRLQFVYAPLLKSSPFYSANNSVMEYIVLPSCQAIGNSANYSALKGIYMRTKASGYQPAFSNMYTCPEIVLWDNPTDDYSYYTIGDNCYNLQDLYLLGNQVCSLYSSTTCFRNTIARSYYHETYYTGPEGAKMKIHVPEDLVSSYESNTNWAALPNIEFVGMTAAEIAAKKKFYLDIQDTWKAQLLVDYPDYVEEE